MKEKIKKGLNYLHISLPYIILIISNIIFCIAYYIITVLKEINFYEMIYYFTSDTSGTSPSIIIDGIKTCYLIFIIIMVLLIIPITNYKKLNLNLKINKKNIKIYPNNIRNHKLAYSIIILIVSILIIFKTMSFDDYLIDSTKNSDIYETYYKNPNNVEITFPNTKRNLILIYLESMESSLVKEENGGTFKDSIIPELEEIALNNINFSNTEKIGGAYTLKMTAWTLASTVASTSGTPLLPQFKMNYKELNRFMPNIKTLGDVLKNEGYNLEIIQGSNIEFAGVDTYYKLHGDYKIFDLNTAKEKELISQNYYEWWGFEDKKLFEYSKNEILELEKEEKPFAISIFTMDTHFKDGYVDASCEEKFESHLSNAYACSSKMINEFIEWIKEQPFYNNTTIVLIGDHTTMQNEYYDDYPNYIRTTYNAFINSAVNTTNNKNREFSTFDMYPTILRSLGAEINGEQLGFGINLFSEKKTIIEEIGKEKFNDELVKKSDYYMKEILKQK